MVRHSKYSRRVGVFELFHAAAAAIEQQAQLVVGMEDAGDLINQVADAHQFRVGWPVQSEGGLHCGGGHAETFRIALDVAAVGALCSKSVLAVKRVSSGSLSRDYQFIGSARARL